MPAPTTVDQYLEVVRKSGVLEAPILDAYLQKLRAESAWPGEPKILAGMFMRDGLLTGFQARQFLLGKHKGFLISGKYRLLEQLGQGGMGSVYLCEHKVMRHKVAIKVLPTDKAKDPGVLERFFREARAAAALNHPNIVRAHDIDQDGKLNFLVMEYVEGASLNQIVKKFGPMDIPRATHYIRQAAEGLQHAHEAGLIHRDIKAGNMLLNRQGLVKILDMGLARFFDDDADTLTQKYDSESVLGTADYVAPEQALDSHSADTRSDIYSLGVTFYFLLTGRTPFSEGNTTQKLVWHQVRQPRPIRDSRPDAPVELVAIIEKMMAKEPAERYQTPAEVIEVLAPWTATPIAPPPSQEMPQVSPALKGPGSAESSRSTPRPPAWSSSSQTSPGKMGSTEIKRPAVPARQETSSVIQTPRNAPALRPAQSVETQAMVDVPNTPPDGKVEPAPAPPGQARKDDATPALPLPLGRPRRWWVAIAICLGIGIGVGGAFLWKHFNPPKPAPDQPIKQINSQE